MSLPTPTNITTELAKQRNRAAAERTLLAWITHSLTLLGLGIAIDRIAAALLNAFPRSDRSIVQLSHVLGLGIIALGLGVLALAMWQYQISTRSLRDNDIFSSRPLITAATTAVVLFGGASAIILVFRAR